MASSNLGVVVVDDLVCLDFALGAGLEELPVALRFFVLMIKLRSADC